MGPTGPRWAPCRPHEPCYLGNADCIRVMDITSLIKSLWIANICYISHGPFQNGWIIHQIYEWKHGEMFIFIGKLFINLPQELSYCWSFVQHAIWDNGAQTFSTSWSCAFLFPVLSPIYNTSQLLCNITYLCKLVYEYYIIIALI